MATSIPVKAFDWPWCSEETVKLRRELSLRGIYAWRLLTCAGIALIVGCQDQPTTVQGLVTLDGQALEMREGMRGTVVFQPTVSGGTTLNGVIDGRGHYELARGSSALVPPSEYWVTVSAVKLLPPTKDHPQAKGRRVTPAKYASASESGFRVEVVPGMNQVNLAMTSDAESPADQGPLLKRPSDEPQRLDDAAAEASAAATE
jgi:hypothetical protein